MRNEASAPPAPLPEGQDDLVKRAFMDCISVEAGELREEALRRLEEKTPSVAKEVRQLLHILDEGVWAERISQFAPELVVSQADAEPPLASQAIVEAGNSVWLQGQEGAKAILNPTSETPLAVSRELQSQLKSPSECERYRFDGEIARGGMGAILKGRDTALGRHLAVKVLLPEHGAKPDNFQRFIDEAHIGVQQQQPGIVPPYDDAHLSAKRPSFTTHIAH